MYETAVTPLTPPDENVQTIDYTRLGTLQTASLAFILVVRSPA